MDVFFDFLKELWWITAEMAPYLLFGFAAAGALYVLIRPEWVQRWLGGRGLWETVKGSLVGVPLPLCSCSVIPVTASLRKQGAGRGATVSFLTATPQTGVDSIFATWALMGPVFTVARLIAAFFTGITAGVLTEWLLPENKTDRPAAAKVADAEDCDEHDCCAGKIAKPEPTCCESQEADCCHENAEQHTGKTAAFGQALRYGFITMPQEIGRSLLFGLLLAGLISALLPEDFFTQYLGNQWLALVAVTLVAVPLYVCSTGSIPFAYALIAAGLSPGAALVFLIAGPATNTATVATMWKILGRSTTVLYIVTLVVTAWICGLVFDWLPVGKDLAQMAHEHKMEGLTWLNHLSAGLLLAILGYALLPKRWLSKLSQKS